MNRSYKIVCLGLVAALPIAAPAWAQSANPAEQEAGEIHASAKTALLEDSRFLREAALDRLRGTETTGMVAWGRGFGSWGKSNGEGGTADLNRDTTGAFVGADGQFSAAIRAGVLAGYSRDSFDGTRGAGDSSNIHVGLYGGGQWGAVALRLGAAFTRHAIDTERLVSAGNALSTLRSGDTSVETSQLFGEFGYRILTEKITWEPFANLAYLSLKSDDFAERAAAAALSGKGASTDVSFSTLGVHGQGNLALGGLDASVKGALGWRHAFGDTTPQTSLALAGGNPFTVTGAPVGSNVAALDLNLDFNTGIRTVFSVAYNGQFGSGVSDNGLRAGVRTKF
jgi:outer membrane autotransporter protein